MSSSLQKWTLAGVVLLILMVGYLLLTANSRLAILEARIIVNEKAIARMQAKEEYEREQWWRSEDYPGRRGGRPGDDWEQAGGDGNP